jgi:hypothetical protein
MANKTQQEQTPQQEQRIPNRRERRMMLRQQGVLKYLSKLSFFNPIRANFRMQNLQTGIKIQETRRARIEKEWEASFNARLENMKISWTALGYNEAEIALLEESEVLTFVKDKDTYREDKKRSKQLSKQAAELKAARNK